MPPKTQDAALQQAAWEVASLSADDAYDVYVTALAAADDAAEAVSDASACAVYAALLEAVDAAYDVWATLATAAAVLAQEAGGQPEVDE